MRKMIFVLVGFFAGAILAGTGVVFASVQGPAPREVDLAVPCQTENQLNCTWYGQKYWPGSSENPPSYTQAYWYNWSDPDTVTFCRYSLVPVRMLTCATHWPLTSADYSAARRASRN